MTPDSEHSVRQNHHRRGLLTMEFGKIDAPGTYVLIRGGLLVRVPEDGMAKGRSPLVSISGAAPVMVAKISDDPWIPVQSARGLAANHDLTVNF